MSEEQEQDRDRPPPGSWFSALSPLIWGGLWLLMMATALETRPFMPVDETRYLAVAWEMWIGGDYLVPHLNGQTYSHKPPLLFWLMNAGWAVFGLNDWWPRLVAPLFSLSSLFLCARLGRWLWPEIRTISGAAPLILLGCLFWTLFATLTMFDMILTFCALLAMNGLVGAWRRNSSAGFVIFAIAIGLGILTKGPAILLTTLPPALLAPIWGKALGDSWLQGWKQWYLKCGLALLGGVAIGLAWAIPAGIFGGEEYRNAIFWGQSAGRMVNSFAHGEPWWWYLAILPALILPWTIWPASWRSISYLFMSTGGGFYKGLGDGGLRFCLTWFLPAFITFSAISGKQFHYLLPVFPALALMLARLLVERDDATSHAPVGEKKWSRSGILLPALPFLILGICLYLIAPVGTLFDLPTWAGKLNTYPGIGLSVVALGLILLDRVGGPSSLMARLTSLCILSVTLVIVTHHAAKPLLAERFDLRPLSQKIGAWQEQGVPIAYVGTYHGQFHFMGRLTAPIAAVGKNYADLLDWLAANPEGRIIVINDAPSTEAPSAVNQPYRGRYFTVFAVADVVADPTLLK